MPCPYCVIFSAVQRYSGSAAIRPATTLVLPTLRECPPITTIAMGSDSSRAGAPAPHNLLLCQARQGCQLLQIFAYWLCRRSPESNSLPPQHLVGQDAALSSQQDAFFDAGVFPDADLAAKNDVLLDGDAAGKAGLGGDYNVFSDLAVMAD